MGELLDALEPLRNAARDSTQAQALAAALGWDVDAVLGPEGDALGPALRDLDSLAAQLEGELPASAASIADTAGQLAAVGALSTAVRSFAEALPPAAAALPSALLEDLVLRHLGRRRPLLFGALRLLGIIDVATDAAIEVDGTVVRHEVERHVLRPERLGTVVKDPAAALRASYLPAGLATPEEAAAAGARLLGPVADLLEHLGVESLVGAGLGPETVDARRHQQLAASMTFVRRFLTDGTASAIGATVSLVPADLGGPGVFVLPFGSTGLEVEDGNWRFSAALAGADLGGALITPGGTRFTGSAAEPAMVVTLGLERLQRDGVAARLGGRAGTRLEAGRVAWRADARFARDGYDVAGVLDLGTCAAVLAAADGDGFLATVLPAGGLRADFDLAIGWSSRHGLRVRGGGGLTATVPVDRSVGPLRIGSVTIGVAAEDAALRLGLGVDLSLTLGPVGVMVQGVGVTAKLAFPAEGGNLGPADASIGFKAPDGAGLRLDAGAVRGGGALIFDRERGEYAGAVHLELGPVAVKALGLISTTKPAGFSLLVIISAEFPPIQLGYGFTLNGVGGLVGVNRTMDVDALRAGVQTGALADALFPRDPVADAPRLLRTIATTFPAQEGRFVVGPMLVLGWGVPTLVTLSLALALELPAPVRIVLAGRLRAALPDERVPIVRLQMDLLGVVDFDRGEVSLDAALVDSRLAQYAISGSMALRAGWGERPTFLLAVGGHHPDFAPPPGFPALERVTVALAAGEQPRLRLEAYLALSSGTVMFGARLDLYASAVGCAIEGELGFDAMLELAPFGFVVDIAGAVTVRRGRRVLMTVGLDLALSGPTPWRAYGKARFKLGPLKKSITVDVQVGDPEPPALPEPVRIADRVAAALADRRNWSALPPAHASRLVTLRDRASDPALMVHPLGRLVVRQREAPLDELLTRIGSARVAGAQTLHVSAVRIGPDDAPHEPVRDAFARAQFFDMTQDERLSQPAFEELHSGVQLGTGRLRHGRAATTQLEHERVIVRTRTDTGTRSRPPALETAGALATARPAGSAHLAGRPIRLQLLAPRYATASLDDLAPTEPADGSVAGSFSSLVAQLAGRPAARVQVVEERLAIRR